MNPTVWFRLYSNASGLAWALLWQAIIRVESVIMSTKGQIRGLTRDKHYVGLVGGIGDLLEAARRTSARTLNALMTATYWEVGRRIVEFEQQGEKHAEYGTLLVARLAQDLTARFKRG